MLGSASREIPVIFNPVNKGVENAIVQNKYKFWQEWLSIVLLQSVSTPINTVLTYFTSLKIQNMDQESAKKQSMSIKKPLATQAKCRA